jgi:Tfp pilus assembly protein PilF
MWNFEEARAHLRQVWEQSNHTHSHAAMNLGHVFLLQQEKDKAIKWYQRSLGLWEEEAVFWGGMERDFVDLRMAERGISEQDYAAMLHLLKDGIAGSDAAK